jgi:hypothetical protein
LFPGGASGTGAEADSRAGTARNRDARKDPEGKLPLKDAAKQTFCQRSGVDVMITILCDFCQFSAKKLFSQKPML